MVEMGFGYGLVIGFLFGMLVVSMALDWRWSR